MKKLMMVVWIILLIIIGVFSIFLFDALFMNRYKTIDKSTADEMNHPFFEIDEELELNKEELAKYLYSQKLELAKEGKWITSTEGTNNPEKVKVQCDKLVDYEVISVGVDSPRLQFVFVESDIFQFTVRYSVLPKNKKILFIDWGSSWEYGNGILQEDGWVRDKSFDVKFKKEGNGYRFVSEGCG